MIKKNHANLRFWMTALLAAALVPLLNTVLLGPLRTMLASDIMTPELLLQILGYLSEVLNIACLYASFACLAYALATSAQVGLTLLLIGIAFPLLYLAAGMVDAAFYGNAVLDTAYLLYSAISCLYELLRLAAAAIFCRLSVYFAKKKNKPLTLALFSRRGIYSCAGLSVTLITVAFMLLSNVTETVTLLLTHGAPVNASEIFTLLSPYITTGIWAILGYLLVVLLLRFFVGAETIEEA